MSADPHVVERIVVLAQQLSPEDRMLVIRRIAETLGRPTEGRPHRLQFGKYKGGRMSTSEDFTMAEWRPTDKELYGH